tara:strand:+ start:2219 stop:2650 length:432 start_codon:yes stop_codon:yes gene_type:complete
MHRWRHQEDGVAATEFALVVPMLALLLVGIYDFGIYINQQMKLENAARASAEYLMRGGDANDISTAIVNNIVADNNGITFTSNEVCECAGGTTVSCGSNGSCDDGYKRRYRSVLLTQTYEPFFDFPGIPDNLELTGHARVQVQ